MFGGLEVPGPAWGRFRSLFVSTGRVAGEVSGYNPLCTMSAGDASRIRFVVQRSGVQCVMGSSYVVLARPSGRAERSPHAGGGVVVGSRGIFSGFSAPPYGPSARSPDRPSPPSRDLPEDIGDTASSRTRETL